MNLVFLVTFLRYTCLLVIPLLFVRLVFLSFLVFFCFRAFLLFLFCVFSVFLPFPRSLLIPYFYHSHISLPIPRFTSFQLFFVISRNTVTSFLRHTTLFPRHSTSFPRHSTSFPRRRESSTQVYFTTYCYFSHRDM